MVLTLKELEMEEIIDQVGNYNILLNLTILCYFSNFSL